jgi:pseudouridylate synthase
MPLLPKSFKLSEEVQAAIKKGQPIVALESTVITHGLPKSHNLQLAREMEKKVREEGAAPATIAVVEGRICVGLSDTELASLAKNEAHKLSSRDLAAAVTAKASGGTTVAGTLRVASQAGIKVFATGGIGGVHRDSNWDISADLAELAAQQVLLVCAGAKAILDLPATLEQFETRGIPVVGYQTNEFPAFFSRESGLKTSARVDGAKNAAALANQHWELGGGGILLAVPLPEKDALPRKKVEGWTEEAMKSAKLKKISGQALTPFLLKRVTELSDGKSLEANLALLKNNARVAAQVAKWLPIDSVKTV